MYWIAVLTISPLNWSPSTGLPALRRRMVEGLEWRLPLSPAVAMLEM